MYRMCHKGGVWQIYRICHKGTILFSVLNDEPIHPTNQTLHQPIFTLSVLKDKEYSKPNGLVKLKVPELVTSNGEFVI